MSTYKPLYLLWLIQAVVEQAPEGYPQVATLQCSDRNFLQFRSFSYLHTRLVLALQQDIEKLEQQLDRLDDFDAKHGDSDKLTCKARDDRQQTPDRIDSGEFHRMFRRTRPQVLAELKEKLMEYGTTSR